MIERLRLKTYRGFDEHDVELRPLTVVVGENNAGKSTLVEALRVLSIVTARLNGLHYRRPPAWSSVSSSHRGVSPSLTGLGIQFSTISHRYADSPAEVEIDFQSGSSMHCYINTNGDSYCVLRDSRGRVVLNKAQAQRSTFPRIEVLPQITPLEPDESILRSDEYVERHASSLRSSRHFRNQLRLDAPAYIRFRQLAEETWKGIQILQLEGARGLPGDQLRLLVRDHDFAAEVGLMGHGLQMWLQTIWFLSRADPSSTVVLDEPDIYMHPDLQRRLIRLVRPMFPQVIVATHSLEIVADLDPSEILIVDKGQCASRFADTLPAVQTLIDKIGGIHNVHLARLWSARRFVLVEGDDLGYLKTAHDKLFPDTSLPLDDIPNAAIGGWDNWQYAIGQTMFARNALGEKVRIYCILDSDYRTPEELAERKEQAKSCRVDLHVWQRKELENYFLIPAVVARVVCSRRKELDREEVAENVKAEIYRVVSELREDTFDQYATSYRSRHRRWSVSKANQEARRLLKGVFDQPSEALRIVSGKEVLRRLSSWLHAEYGQGIGLRHLLRTIRVDELDPEVKDVLTAIEYRRPLG